MRKTFVILLTFITTLITTPSFAVNRVLSLDGDGDYVEVKDSASLNAINSQVTMEACIKATAFTSTWMPLIYKGDKLTPNFSNRSYTLWLNSSGFIELTSAPSLGGQIYLDSPSGLIALNRWYHIAGVIDAKSGKMKIFINGTEVASQYFGKDIHLSALPLWIGWTHEVGAGAFAGQIDEVRIWNIARTPEAIRRTMFTTLSGKEPGLVGYWNYDDSTANDSSSNHSDGKLMGDAHFVEAELPNPSKLAVLSGMITDEAGKPIQNASIRLEHPPYPPLEGEQGGNEIAQAMTDSSGNYRIAIFDPVPGKYVLSATADELGDWRLGIRLRGGETQTMNLILTQAISIAGTILMLDNITPHVAIVVQAVMPTLDSKEEAVVVATTLSDESGKYQFINLKPGDYQVRCYTGEYVYFGQQAPTMTGTILRVEHMMNSTFDQTFLKFEGKTLKNIDFRFPPFKKGVWRHYTRLDGLVHNTVNRIYVDSEGFIWLGTDSGGISRFDGGEFLNFTAEDGLPLYPCIWAIHQDADGMMWFGLWENGVYRGVYPFDNPSQAQDSAGSEARRREGKKFAKFAQEEEGLAHANVMAIANDSDGVLWFGTWVGTWGRGVYRYDGENLLNFTQKDGLQSNAIFPSHCDPDGMMWFWTPPGWFSRYDGKEFTNFTEKDALVNNDEAFVNLKSHHNLPIHRAPKGGLWVGRSLWGTGVLGYNGKRFVNFTTADGLPHNRVESIQSTSDGVVWFGMWGGGISSYDGRGLINFTTEDGLLSNIVKHLYIDTDGVIWVATGSAILGFERGGLSRYDPRGFVNFTTRDGLPSNAISTLQRSSDGALWIGTCGGGISRYDGKKFVNFTTKDGLVGNYVTTMALDADGIFWFGTGARHVPGNGVSRYDTKTGKFLQPLTTQEGLASNTILSIFTAADGIVWFGTTAGISRYDTRSGKFLQPLTTQDGLASDNVRDIYCDPDGMMWFDTYQADVTRYDGNQFTNFEYREGMIRLTKAFHRDADKVIWSRWFVVPGVGRYDGNQFVHLTPKDGLADNQIRVIYPNTKGVCVAAPDEVIWLGTDSKGVSFYDGVAWSSLDTRDGLAGNTVTSIVQDADGSLWFGTQDGGLTHYRRTSSRPKIHIVSVTTDKTYRNLDDIPILTTGTRATIEYNAIDFKTIPEKRQYRVRIKEIDPDWCKPTKSTSFDYTFDKPDNYTFEVQAIDRDLNYSDTASLTLKVMPPFYLRASFLLPTVSLGTILVALLTILSIGYIKRRRQVHSYQELAVRELQDAHDMQMSLMPKTAPPIEGVEIAGRCLPANTVSGDFFDYLEGKHKSEIALVVADVTGKAMKGAMNAVMADGILRTAAIEQEQFTPASLMMTLNNALKGRMEQYMNVTMVIGTIDAEAKTLTLANAAHHAYPILLHDGESKTLKTGGLPLGMRAGIKYSEEPFQLQSGDVVIFMTDGIIEAQDSEGKMYSDSGRLEESISQFTVDLSAEAMVDVILNDAMNFGGDKAQRDDDMTVVVAKVL